MNNTSYLVDNAKVMSEGQITLPKDILKLLRLGTGDKVTFVCEGDRVVLMNSAVYAMKIFQKGLAGEAEKAGIGSEDDAYALFAEMRRAETP